MRVCMDGFGGDAAAAAAASPTGPRGMADTLSAALVVGGAKESRERRGSSGIVSVSAPPATLTAYVKGYCTDPNSNRALTCALEPHGPPPPRPPPPLLAPALSLSLSLVSISSIARSTSTPGAPHSPSPCVPLRKALAPLALDTAVPCLRRQWGNIHG